MTDERLFCFDVAIENLVILKTEFISAQNDSFSKISLLAQFLSFAPLRLCEDLPRNLLSDFSNDDKKIIRLQTGKSALLRSNFQNFVDQLKNDHLVLALVGYPAERNASSMSPILILNAKLSLSTASSYFMENKNENVGDDHMYPLKFTSTGAVDLKDDLGRKRAELQIGYRLWQLGDSVNEFFSQHEQMEHRHGHASAPWLPTNFTNFDNNNANESNKQRIAVNVDTQTDAPQNSTATANAVVQAKEEDKNDLSQRPDNGSISISGSSARSRRSSRSSRKKSVSEVSTAFFLSLFLTVQQNVLHPFLMPRPFLIE